MSKKVSGVTCWVYVVELAVEKDEDIFPLLGD